MWIIAINGEDPIISLGALYELNHHQNPRGKSKVNISLCRRKIYERIDLEEIRSIFDQVRPAVSHIAVHLPEKSLTQNNIFGGLKGPQRQF